MRVALTGAVRPRTARRRPATSGRTIEPGRTARTSAAICRCRRVAARDAVVASRAVIRRLTQAVELTEHARRAGLWVAGAFRAVVAVGTLTAVCCGVRSIGTTAAVPAGGAIVGGLRVSLSC